MRAAPLTPTFSTSDNGEKVLVTTQAFNGTTVNLDLAALRDRDSQPIKIYNPPTNPADPTSGGFRGDQAVWLVLQADQDFVYSVSDQPSLTLDPFVDMVVAGGPGQEWVKLRPTRRYLNVAKSTLSNGTLKIFVVRT